MLILLPPSETKRDGGDFGRRLSLASLRYPQLRAQRTAVLSAVTELAGDDAGSIRALKLGPRQYAEIARNRVLHTSPTMVAVDRYTGVLYDALDAESLDPAARAFAHEHVRIHSALFGPIAALDEIPAYRLSHDSRLPGLPLKKHWTGSLSATLAEHDGLVLDLRSEGYAALGPAPVREGSVFLRVVTAGADGRRKAIGHFNKQSKGLFVRALLEDGIVHTEIEGLLLWAGARGFSLSHPRAGVLELLI